MRIALTAYEVFYKKTCEVFVEKYLNGKKPSGTQSIYTRKIWSEKFKAREHQGEFISPVVYGQNSVIQSREYFYRVKGFIKNNPKYDVDDIWMFNGLIELGYALPDGFPKSASDHDRAMNLWEQFKTQHCSIVEKMSVNEEEKLSNTSEIINNDNKISKISMDQNEFQSNEMLYAALEKISKFYTRPENRYRSEINYFNGFKNQVNLRGNQLNYNPENSSNTIKSFNSENLEMYELQKEKVIFSKVYILKQKPTVYPDGYESQVYIERKGQSVERTFRNSKDFLYFDVLHSNIKIYKATQLRGTPISIEIYKFFYRDDLFGVFPGHKCAYDTEINQVTINQVVLYINDSPRNGRMSYKDLQPNSKAVPDIVKTFLANPSPDRSFFDVQLTIAELLHYQFSFERVYQFFFDREDV